MISFYKESKVRLVIWRIKTNECAISTLHNRSTTKYEKNVIKRQKWWKKYKKYQTSHCVLDFNPRVPLLVDGVKSWQYLHVFFIDFQKSTGSMEPVEPVLTAPLSGLRLSFYTYYISPIEIGLLWAMITYLKSHSMALKFWLQTNMK